MAREWEPDDAINALADEARTLQESEEIVGERHLRQNLLGAISSVVHLALYSDNERIRFSASTYIIDRNLGTVQSSEPIAKRGSDPLEQLLKQLQSSDSSSN